MLVVDDEPSVLRFVARVLREAGYATTIAPDADVALTIVAAAPTPFDLLLTDLMMPGLRGDELVRRLRERDPDLKVLYLTGFSDHLFTERSHLWASEAYVDKPVTVTGLREAVSLAVFGHIHGPPEG